MKFRHEWKHEITQADVVNLRMKLSVIMQPDQHAVNGGYKIRSLYFDDMFDTALKEKINGVNIREKFRLRYYENDTSFILLEKKSKQNGLCMKEQTVLSTHDVHNILNNHIDVLLQDDRQLVRELAIKMKNKGLKPKTIVDYEREPFVYAPGNVRVTIDKNIRTGMKNTDFLTPQSITIPIMDNPIILEVKWDEFLPNIIRDIVQLNGRHTSAFSKYAACRMYE